MSNFVLVKQRICVTNYKHETSFVDEDTYINTEKIKTMFPMGNTVRVAFSGDDSWIDINSNDLGKF